MTAEAPVLSGKDLLTGHVPTTRCWSRLAR